MKREHETRGIGGIGEGCRWQPVTAVWFCLLALSFPALAQNNRATIREYRKVFTTYPYSDPNPIPVIDRIYPYYRFDRYTDQPVDREWTVVELENDYIKVMVLPEIGGKIWTAIEKSTGKPFIYYNHVVKFRDVALRGPWTSGGIEPNYGIIGHTPNCATPVDYLTRENGDGSVSCFIGVLDLLTRTPWRLEINLPADKAYFKTSSFWYNATPLEQPYYTWMNAGIKARGDLQFIYPGTHYLGHEGEYASWPINPDRGKDLSFYEQNDFGDYKSYHVFGRYTDFFGAYWHDEDFGMARYSPHADKAGKKIWIWGLSRQGMIWEKLLTDGDGQYVEVQSGRLFNQSSEGSTFTPFKHRGFAPYATDTWTEYWFPVIRTRGFVKANQYGALNIKQDGGEIKIHFSPTQRIDAKLEVFDGETRIYSKQLVLKPLEPFFDSIKTPVPVERLRLAIDGGRFEYSSREAEVLNRPIESPRGFDWKSVYGLYLQGREKIRQRQYQEASESLESCLRMDPNYAPALTDLAMLEYLGMNFVKAIEYAKRALSIDTYDPAANYYYGLANLEAGSITDARDGFDIAAMSIEYRSAAYTQLGKIYLRQRRFEEAIEYSNRALDFNRYNLDAWQLLAIVHRLQPDRAKAFDALNRILAFDPLNHFARFEKSLWEKDDDSRHAFASMIRNEMPQETYLELAAWYYDIGLLKESATVLRSAPQNPEVLYWLAFVSDGQPDANYESLMRKADSLSPFLIFPFRPETAKVLRWVIERDSSWEPRYYLALICWSKNDELKAWELLKACGSAPDYAPFYAARARLARKLNRSDESLADLKRATDLDNQQWRYATALIGLYTDQSVAQYDRALQIARSFYERDPENIPVGAIYAKTLLLNQQYRQCSELLPKLNLLPYEGGDEGRELYLETHLMLALEGMKAGNYRQALRSIAASRLWPENLGAGMPYPEDLDQRLPDWLEAICHEKLNERAERDLALNRIISFKSGGYDVNSLITALALQRVGKLSEAERLLNDWVLKDANDRLAQWSLKVFKHLPAGKIPADRPNHRIIEAWLLIKK